MVNARERKFLPKSPMTSFPRTNACGAFRRFRSPRSCDEGAGRTAASRDYQFAAGLGVPQLVRVRSLQGV